MDISFLLTVLLLASGGASTLQAQTDSGVKAEPAVIHNTWTSGAPMPTAVSFQMMGVVKGTIHVVGGYTETAAVSNHQIYNPDTKTRSTGGRPAVGDGPGSERGREEHPVCLRRQ